MSEKLDKDDNNKSKKKQSSKKPLCALFQATFYRIVLGNFEKQFHSSYLLIIKIFNNNYR